MLIVLSPAKSLDFKGAAPAAEPTTPDFMKDTRALIKELRKLDTPEIKELMSVSDKIAEENFQRFKQFRSPHKPENAKPAINVFRGDVYLGMEAWNFSEEEYAFAQEHLRILSGLYGLLRPLDLMQPYRLEMGTRFETDRGTNLYQFWGDKLTRKLNQELKAQGDAVLINLASNEYFSALKERKIKARIITPAFLDWKNDQYKMISFFAKKARGMMARYIIQNQLTDPEDLKGFDLGGYGFHPDLSEGDRWVFARKEAVPAG